MSQSEYELLTQTDAGTPCGDLMRRYWQPAALSRELPPGGAPLPVRLLGEDLVLFRDDEGRPGLLGLHCAHRGADLSYGRVEDGGLRCIYHGWLYDIKGRCLDQPGEPEGGEHRGAIHQTAYPCQESGGIVFAYMGPGEPPCLPAYEFLQVPDDHRLVIKIFQGCNYLQAIEGNIDPVHTSFLHRIIEDNDQDQYVGVRGSDASFLTLWGRDVAPQVEVDVVDFGLRIFTVRDAGADKHYLRVTNFVYPSLTAFPAQTGAEGYNVNWHVPIDDTHHWKYAFIFSREKPLRKEIISRGRAENRNKANRYLQDRESMKTKFYSGMGRDVPGQDTCMVEGQGPLQNRDQEHLVSSDKPIVAARKLLLKAIQDVQEGREAPHVVREPKRNRFPQLVVISDVIPSGTNWKDYTKKMEADIQQPSARVS